MAVQLLYGGFGCEKLLQIALRNLNRPFHKLRVGELGNQDVMVGNERRLPLKECFVMFGGIHESFDINGKYGSHQVDLAKPLDTCWFNQFDIVTNFGVTEHLYNQEHAFANVHHMCKLFGYMVHVVPSKRGNHGDWWYTMEWFGRLAKIQTYRVIHLAEFDVDTRLRGGGRHYIHAVLRKERPEFRRFVNPGKKWDQRPYFTSDGFSCIPDGTGE